MVDLFPVLDGGRRRRASAGPAEVRLPVRERPRWGIPWHGFRFCGRRPHLLRYRIVGERRETVDTWRRQVSLENHEGRRLLHIFWRWDGVGIPTFSRSEDFWSIRRRFDP
jgi:hypothetical protein